MTPREIATLVLIGHLVISVVIARKVTWQWVLDEFNTTAERGPERAFAALMALGAAFLWPLMAVFWGLSLLMPRPRKEVDGDD